MTSKRVVIIGGVAGGMSAATRLRRLDESAEIIVLERGGEVSFANCGLPYHLGGVIAERSSLVLQTPRALGARFRLDVRVRSTVTAIDAAGHRVSVLPSDGAAYELTYDKLILATGAAPIRPEIPGVARAHVLRDLDDLDRIMSALDESPRTAVVLGAGYVGLEVAENLAHRGIATAVVQRDPQILTGLDPEMAQPVARQLENNGVRLFTGATATRIDEAAVTLDNGTEAPAELVIAAIGVRPETDLAVRAGLEIGPRGGVAVDHELRTSDRDIYALGDAAEKADAVFGGTRLLALAGPANRHGRLVADSIAGRPVSARPSWGVAIVSVFGLAAASVGANEKQLRAAGRDYRAIHTHPQQHTGYYPGARPISLKLLVDPVDDAILGAQAVGMEGADKRIDVIATAMSSGRTATELAELELAYAPQFGSAKDPVNMLGYVNENLRDGLDRTLQWHELADVLASGARLIDVRGRGQLAEGSIPGSTWIPVEELRARADDLRGGPIVIHCRVGQSAHTAVRLLTELGVDAVNLDGGYLTWRDGTSARDSATTLAAA
ncbi:FAD-dependent oxidoreductase [uncultured Schumannella sp.]|uniref:FAD-dependent oxidoreductase n=1 Tax=uncultured Schumannella sp. TaxID=1195956 RepID=UPI0025E77B16|nr:FAD-dependent oxidoreductase [uncultured Schumannella sp.]